MKDIKKGKLEFPYVDEISAKIPDDCQTVLRMWKALWHNYLNNDTKTTSIPYWSGEFKSQKGFRLLIEQLVKKGWLYTYINSSGNWGEMRLKEDNLLKLLANEDNPTKELSTIRRKYKYKKYALDFTESTLTFATRQNGKTRFTGLYREGFALAGNTQFGYDTEAINKHMDAIKLNITKSMDKIRETNKDLRDDETAYDEVSKGIIDIYANKINLYTCGDNYNDARGRAISSCLSKVGNPISSKDFRALLVVTYD